MGRRGQEGIVMSIGNILDALVSVYQSEFTKAAGDLYIKRVTATVPEAAVEWPWLYFVCDSGDIALMTFSDDLEGTHVRRTFGSASIKRRPKTQVMHHFRGQLLVRPRSDLATDEALIRPFIQPMITLTVENIELGGIVQYVKPMRYRYGKFALGIAEKAIEFIGLEFEYEAKELI
jgi:hypothetical protein